MSLRRSALTRLAITAAAGALVTTAAVTPANADNEWNDTGGNTGSSQWDEGDGNSNSSGNSNGNESSQNGQSNQSNQWNQSGSGDHNGNNNNSNNSGRYRGRVTAGQLLLRSRPTRASQVIRVVHRGDIVSIFCKTSGQNVDGNPLWYLLTDGTWAWGAARYIDNIGEAPRWC
ncbi:MULTISPECIES: SH3 domain-containing protein [Streptomyces]|uniref:SH3 domain-containing protein n=2 Tax=Streptomyces TaxID=1883 RepID=A0ABV9J092_9ACTN